MQIFGNRAYTVGKRLHEKGIILESDDIKKIIAEYFKVEEKDVIKSQYTYTVVTHNSQETEK